ncbi:DUF5076 domain-containing protein [Pseudoxanthomonas wuyuanensis]|uniref:DUF5076 domain-containing protein n=1 Tax=Pseudoxanthomonas wuyuanensis TaxID=1073196 RepID=UPI000BE3FB03|nr:DUF5076 domain-containing protein [Pseudoxanthomonas wuyuanensis]
MKPLIVPPAAQRDEKAIQLFSAWAAENGLHCAMKIGLWHDSGRDEPLSWGILLADAARHIANALQEEYGLDPGDTLADIRQSFDNELGDPTSDVEGGFNHGHT